MNTVIYVVGYRYDYSDYHIEGIFYKKEDADNFIESSIGPYKYKKYFSVQEWEIT